MGRKKFIFSCEEKHFTVLWIDVSYFTLGAIVWSWCNWIGASNSKQSVVLCYNSCTTKSYSRTSGQNLWKIVVKDVF